ncbi:hypothetical protein PVL29_012524 [Vitis rotundifolia]|uniref:Uncharacterized protein n=1 Tax=Vitis rotundifolia TaxID=103349 RepID=A0AA38ZIV6_VITRO|nr:hypothetical protein PVL29_012524 [Vitis rotundifolia]
MSFQHLFQLIALKKATLNFLSIQTQLKGAFTSTFDFGKVSHVECQSRTNILEKRDKSSVLLNRSHVGLKAEELREEEPENLLQSDLDRQTEAVEDKEEADVPGGRRPPHVVEYQLVHHRRHNECCHDRWNWGPLPSEEPRRDVEGG